MGFDFRALVMAKGRGGWSREVIEKSDLPFGQALDVSLKDFFGGRSITQGGTNVAITAYTRLSLERLVTQSGQLLSLGASGKITIFTRNRNMFWADELTRGEYHLGVRSQRDLFERVGEQLKKAGLLYFGPITCLLDGMALARKEAVRSKYVLLNLDYTYS